MLYVTADPHGDFREIRRFAKREELTADDVIVVLGDAGVNYYLNKRDEDPRREIAKIAATIFCIHGNHEERPENLPSLYREDYWHGGSVFVEDSLPNLVFARDGEVYELDGLSTLVVGGAYSIDKDYRLSRGWSWFESEQPSKESKDRAVRNMEACGWKVDLVLTHTCPYSYEPREAFLEGVDQNLVDKTTEHWLDWLEKKLNYRAWLCGHWHISKQVDRVRFMFHEIEPLRRVLLGIGNADGDPNPSKIFYTSDLHIGHKNIIDFCSRPFVDVDEMNTALIANWNSRVRDVDEVYVVGDMFYRCSASPEKILEQLNGTKHLVVGNHDSKWMKSRILNKYFESVDDLVRVNDGGREAVLCHYPMFTWSGRRSYHVYGHIHNNVSAQYIHLLLSMDKALNACVEVNGYMPVTLDELVENNERWRKKHADHIDECRLLE